MTMHAQRIRAFVCSRFGGGWRWQESKQESKQARNKKTSDPVPPLFLCRYLLLLVPEVWMPIPHASRHSSTGFYSIAVPCFMCVWWARPIRRFPCSSLQPLSTQVLIAFGLGYASPLMSRLLHAPHAAAAACVFVSSNQPS